MILVVEDNETNMKLVRGLLSIGRYKILEAGDAESGIALAQEHEPDLILMDIQLPGMDGLDATRIIKANPKTENIPVVALTSYAMQRDKDMAMEAGCAGYISKPIDTRAFMSSIKQYLRKRKEEND